jgi:excinuclease ABC subunit A
VIKRELTDALLNLGRFSHCFIFTKDDRGFHCCIARITSINKKTGELLLDLLESDFRLSGELVDIKPYFPCEEQPDGYDKELALRENILLS